MSHDYAVTVAVAEALREFQQSVSDPPGDIDDRQLRELVFGALKSTCEYPQ